MIVKLKKGKIETTVKTSFGGVYFLEGEEGALDHTKVLPEERAKIMENFDIIDHRGCEWAGGKPGLTDAEKAEAKAKADAEKAEAKAKADAEKAEAKAKADAEKANK